MAPTIAPENEPRPPSTTAMKPEMVNSRPVSNCSEVVGRDHHARNRAQRRRQARSSSSVMRRHVHADQPGGDAVLGAGAERAADRGAGQQQPDAGRHGRAVPSTHSACSGTVIGPSRPGRPP